MNKLLNVLHSDTLLFKPSQSRICLPIISRLYTKMMLGIVFSDIKVEGDMICDGHHRYIASVLANIELRKICSIRTTASEQMEWTSVIIDQDDWDTEAKVKILNEMDALYNNISLKDLVEIMQES